MILHNDKRLILYGKYIDNERFIFHHYDLQNINKVIDVMDDCKIECKLISDEELYIVTGTWEQYLNFKKKYDPNDAFEFKKYLWGELYGKNMVCINANCHGTALTNFLELSNEFKKNYKIYPVPNIHLNDKGYLSEVLLSLADVYIHQDIRKDNKISYYLSDEYILQFISKDCKEIVIPNLVGMGKWLYPNLKEIFKDIHEENNLVFIDEVLESAYDILGKTAKIEDYCGYWNDFEYKEEYLIQLKDEYENKIKNREGNWTIKISDYIDKYFRTIPMFVDGGHPSRYVMAEIGRQVLKQLGIPNDVDDSGYNSYLGMPVPVCASIKNFYGICYGVQTEPMKSFLWRGSNAKDDRESLKRYIAEYMWWVHRIKL